jgi:hypothetical protein
MSERSIWSRIAGGRLVVTRVGRITLVCVASIHALLDAPSAAPGKVAPRAVDAPWETEAFAAGCANLRFVAGNAERPAPQPLGGGSPHRSHRPCWAELPPPPNCETDNGPKEGSEHHRDDETAPQIRASHDGRSNLFAPRGAQYISQVFPQRSEHGVSSQCSL